MYVFQYGSNMSTARLNSSGRLRGDAEFVSIVSTLEKFELDFTVWSGSNDCAAADLVPSKYGRKIFGALYTIPEDLIFRDMARSGRTTMDAIEGEGRVYERINIGLLYNQSEIEALTYIVKEKKTGLKTKLHYAQHIIDGVDEHPIPTEYREYVVARVELNNPELKGCF